MRNRGKRPHSGRKDTRKGVVREKDNIIEARKAKKSLGQHFLTSTSALDKIIDAGDIKADDIIVEVGPGRGILTEQLLAFAGKVMAIEKDRELMPELEEKFSEEIEGGRLTLIEGDILNIGSEIFGMEREKSARGQSKPHSYKVIANIPYYITNAIIRLFLENTSQPEKMVILIQKEVAERIVAKDGKESLLSVAVKIYGTPKIVAKVPAGAFNPPPKVDSAILSIDNISKQDFANIDESAFFTIVRTGFAHKRKKLAGNLADLYGKEKILSAFATIGMPIDTRAEDISIDQWKKLVQELVK
ncbi:MAG: dimethyladenosine transferase, rRNA (adenine1518-N6/adenine1519-N6)-dimethyltransferase [Candidatus Parcubacteria bacterium]|jgi:16S rRNA (adenine1518-N6/adenine1519-N6)-dimethyltransferase